MEARMSTVNDFIRWCQKERMNLLQQREQLVSGVLHTGEKQVATAMVDTTAQSLEQVKQKIAELDVLLGQNPADRLSWR